LKKEFALVFTKQPRLDFDPSIFFFIALGIQLISTELSLNLDIDFFHSAFSRSVKYLSLRGICGSQHCMSGWHSLQSQSVEEFEMPGASMIDIDSSRPLRFTNLESFLVAEDE
jgi:hypothetical protein